MTPISSFRPSAVEREARARRHIQVRQRYGLLFGLVGGLIFALATWGSDALALAAAHGWFPWAKLLLGVVPCMMLAGLVGWLSMRLNRAPLSALLWGVAGVLFAGWVGAVLLAGVPLLLGWTDPALARVVDLSYNAGLAARLSLLTLLTGGALLVASFFAAYLVDGASGGSSAFERLWPLVLWCLFFGAAGFAADSLLHEPMRLPVQAADNLIALAQQNARDPVDEATARAAHLAATRAVQPLLDRPRRLILSDYDETLVITRVVIDFDGTLVECSLSYNQAGFCETIGGADG